MARRGSLKELSVRHEDWIADRYDGRRSASSGGALNDQGDIRTDEYLIECKMTGGPGKPIKKPKFVKDMEKITEEAWSEGKIPMLALRYYDPDSILADADGWIDLVMKRVSDDSIS